MPRIEIGAWSSTDCAARFAVRKRVERLIVERAVDERLAERPFARPHAVSDLLRVACGDREVVDRLLRLLVERVVLS